jgi:hypothetical protein
MTKSQENAVTLATLVALTASGGKTDANANNYRMRLQLRWNLTVDIIKHDIIKSIVSS